MGCWGLQVVVEPTMPQYWPLLFALPPSLQDHCGCMIKHDLHGGNMCVHTLWAGTHISVAVGDGSVHRAQRHPVTHSKAGGFWKYTSVRAWRAAAGQQLPQGCQDVKHPNVRWPATGAAPVVTASAGLPMATAAQAANRSFSWILFRQTALPAHFRWQVCCPTAPQGWGM